MNTVSTQNGKRMEADADGPVLLEGRLPAAARALWLLVALLSIGLFVAGVPYRYRELLELCNGTGCRSGQLSSEEMSALAEMGLSPAAYAAYSVSLAALSAVTYCGIAVLIFWRQSRHLMALLVSLWLVTFGIGIGTVTPALATAKPALGPLVQFLSDLGWVALIGLFLFTFPDGRFAPPWTRWLVVVVLILGLVGPVLERVFPMLANAAIPQVFWFTLVLTGIGAQVYRYRRVSGPIQRQQTKWVVFGLVAIVLVMVLYELIRSPMGEPGRGSLLGKLAEMTIPNLAFLIIPLTIGISVMRYRLWDIDRIIRRTLVYGALTAILALVYFGSVVLLQAVVGQFAGAQSPIAIVISTLLIAALFAPLRRRVQDFIDRRFYRRKYDAAQTLAQFAAVARDEVDIERLVHALMVAVHETMRPAHMTLWLQGAAGDSFAERTS